MSIISHHASILFSPWVLRAAWAKVRNWGETAVWPDPAEMLAWEADPLGELSRLATQLSNDTWSPSPFPLLPYPKKGDQTRHFCQPSVRDQVAFAVFMVLLGPFLEARMPNVSFGNRLFRPRVLLRSKIEERSEHDDPRPRWFRAPFSLGQQRVYESFSSGYGLFRRLLQWVVNDGVLGDAPDNDNDNEERIQEDPDLLPYLQRGTQSPWRARQNQDNHLFYLRVDLSTAYPALNRQATAKTLRNVLRDDTALHSGLPSNFEQWGMPTIENRLGQGSIWGPAGSRSPFPSWLESARPGLGDHPWRLLAANAELRVHLADQLIRALDEIEYAPWMEPSDWDNRDITDGRAFAPPNAPHDALAGYDTGGLWRPSVSVNADVLASQRFGLPTGLIIGGLLCNVALSPLDWHFCRRYEDACHSKEEPRLLYLRFVDDIVLVSERVEQLFEAVQQMQKILGEHPCIKINVEKTRPKAFSEHVARVLRGDEPPSSYEVGLLPRLTRANTELFTTEMVREMSELGEEALDERYGGPGLERTERLLNLLGRGDSDEEVADAARLSFALGRLAQASWPEGPVGKGERIIHPDGLKRLVLRSAERALRSHPARTQLWRPTLILALRANDFGTKILKTQILPLISWSSPPNETSSAAWNTWEGIRPAEPEFALELPNDEVLASKITLRRIQHRRLRASWHRAAFWRHWVSVLQELRQRVNVAEPRMPRAGSWLSHMTIEDAKKALKTLEDLNHWVSVLYPDGLGAEYWGQEGPFLWWWEAEALRMAMLALTPADQTVLQWLGPPSPGRLHAIDGLPPGVPAPFSKSADLRIALARVLGPRLKPLDQDQAALTLQNDDGASCWWISRLAPSTQSAKPIIESTSNEIQTSPPCTNDARLWAGLARLLRPDQLASWSANLGQPLARPMLEVNLADNWRRTQLLDIYHHLRRASLATGGSPPWGHYQAWFDDVGFGIRRADSEIIEGSSIYQALLSLPHDLRGTASTGQGAASPAQCPAFGVPSALGIWLMDALNTLVQNISTNDSLDSTDQTGEDARNLYLTKLHKACDMVRPPITPESVRLTHSAAAIVRAGRVWSVAGTNDEENAAWRLLAAGETEANPNHDEFGARLAEQIHSELNAARSGGGSGWILGVAPLGDQDPAPHPMFLFGHCFLDVSTGGSPERWSMSSLLLWLLTGCEADLDRLYALAPWQPSVFDRQTLRSRLLLPRNTWAWLEEGFGSLSASITLGVPGPTNTDIALDLPDSSSVFDVRLALDRADVQFDEHGEWQVTARTSNLRFANPAMEPAVLARLLENVRVRLVQPVEKPDLQRWLGGPGATLKPLVDDAYVFRNPLRELCVQLAELRLRSRQPQLTKETSATDSEESPRTHDARNQFRYLDDLALFPEWYVPHFEVGSLIQFVRETGVAIIAGLSPRELPRMVRCDSTQKENGLRVLVNEALVVLPARASSLQGAGRGVAVFWVRKPYPNAQEQGLALHLSDATGTPWRFQRGLTWTRFRLPTWGGFTVAICSDILDTFAWDWLRGRIQHLFVVAYNTDLDLFDKMTWTRAYELFANVAMSNHGSQGGSLSWTPRHGMHKQLFEVKGQEKGIAVTVELPVRALHDHQRTGVTKAAGDSKVDFWDRVQIGTKPQKIQGAGFKSPAPGYRLKKE